MSSIYNKRRRQNDSLDNENAPDEEGATKDMAEDVVGVEDQPQPTPVVPLSPKVIIDAFNEEWSDRPCTGEENYQQYCEERHQAGQEALAHDDKVLNLSALQRNITELVYETRMGRHPSAKAVCRYIDYAKSAAAEDETEKADSEKALKAAVVSYNPTKKYEMNFTALIDATRADDVKCEPLTVDSDDDAIKKACWALAAKLETMTSLNNKEYRTNKQKLHSLLAFPQPQLIATFGKELRSESQVGAPEQAMERELSMRRQSIVSSMITQAPTPAHVKQKYLLRCIRTDYPDAWMASCGTELEKANAALDNNRMELPPSVVEKWQDALLVVHGTTCKFKKQTKTNNGHRICGNHIFKFQMSSPAALASASLDPAAALPPNLGLPGVLGSQ